MTDNHLEVFHQKCSDGLQSAVNVLARAMLETDSGKRAQALKQAHAQLVDNQVPVPAALERLVATLH